MNKIIRNTKRFVGNSWDFEAHLRSEERDLPDEISELDRIRFILKVVPSDWVDLAETKLEDYCTNWAETVQVDEWDEGDDNVLVEEYLTPLKKKRFSIPQGQGLQGPPSYTELRTCVLSLLMGRNGRGV